MLGGRGEEQARLVPHVVPAAMTVVAFSNGMAVFENCWMSDIVISSSDEDADLSEQVAVLRRLVRG